LSPILKRYSGSLRELDLAYNEINEVETLNIVLRTIVKYTQITKLNVSGISSVDNETAINIINLFNKQLITHFIFRGRNLAVTEISPEQTIMTEVSTAIAHNRSLRVLDLTHNQIKPDAAAAIAEALKINQQLKCLILDDNKLFSQGVAAIAEAMCVNQGLEILSLNNVIATGSGNITGTVKLHLGYDEYSLIKLKQMLEQNKTLKELYLRENDINEEELGFVLTAINKNKSIQIIDISGCNLLFSDLNSMKNNIIKWGLSTQFMYTAEGKFIRVGASPTFVKDYLCDLFYLFSHERTTSQQLQPEEMNPLLNSLSTTDQLEIAPTTTSKTLLSAYSNRCSDQTTCFPIFDAPYWHLLIATPRIAGKQEEKLYYFGYDEESTTSFINDSFPRVEIHNMTVNNRLKQHYSDIFMLDIIHRLFRGELDITQKVNDIKNEKELLAIKHGYLQQLAKLSKEYKQNRLSNKPNYFRAKIVENDEVIVLEFEEHVVVTDDGSCGFTALKTDRSSVQKTLLLSSADQQKRELLQEEIQDAFISGDRLPTELQQLANEYNKIIDFEDKKKYCERQDVFEAYANALGENIWIGYKSMILYAMAENVSIYIWSKNEGNDHLQIRDSYIASQPSDIIHIFHTQGFTHFNILSETKKQKEQLFSPKVDFSYRKTFKYIKGSPFTDGALDHAKEILQRKEPSNSILKRTQETSLSSSDSGKVKRLTQFFDAVTKNDAGIDNVALVSCTKSASK
ncbi:MAG: hypothetical protein ACK4PR_09435, partial [Gammaproteobacteria bacterium]